MDFSFLPHLILFFESQEIPITFSLICKEWYFLVQEFFLSRLAKYYNLKHLTQQQLYQQLLQLNRLRSRDILSLEYAARKTLEHKIKTNNKKIFVQYQIDHGHVMEKMYSEPLACTSYLQQLENLNQLLQRQVVLKDTNMSFELASHIKNRIKNNLSVKRYDTSERFPLIDGHVDQELLGIFWNVSFTVVVPPHDLLVISSLKETISNDSDIRLNDRALLEHRAGLYYIHCNQLKLFWSYLSQNFPFQYDPTLIDQTLFDHLAISDQTRHTLYNYLHILLVIFEVFQLNFNQNHQSLFNSLRNGSCQGNVLGVEVILNNNAYSLR